MTTRAGGRQATTTRRAEETGRARTRRAAGRTSPGVRTRARLWTRLLPGLPGAPSCPPRLRKSEAQDPPTGVPRS